jgi:hypothetical protein
MRLAWIFTLLIAMTLAGCGGDSPGINEGKDRPVHPKKDKDKDK